MTDFSALDHDYVMDAAYEMFEALEGLLALKQWERPCATPGKPTEEELDAVVALSLGHAAIKKAKGT